MSRGFRGWIRGLVVACLLACAPAALASGGGPAPSASDGATSADVVLGDVRVFTLHHARGAQSVTERAAAVRQALETALREGRRDVRIDIDEQQAVIYAGEIPLIGLDDADRAASGDETLKVHAERVAAQLRDALRREGTRSAVARQVLSVSLVVFLGLVALYLMQAAAMVSQAGLRAVEARRARGASLRVRSLELLPPGATRDLSRLGVQAALWAARIVVLITWLVASASLFEATRGLAAGAASALLTPFAELFGRIAASVPATFAVATFAMVVVLVLRFVRIYFGSIARGEVVSDRVRPEAAPAAGALVQGAVVFAALMFILPLLTGLSDGPGTRVALFIALAFALGGAPLGTIVLLGARAIFLPTLRVGDEVEYGGVSGQVAAVGLFDADLREADGRIAKVPHLRALWLPTRKRADQCWDRAAPEPLPPPPPRRRESDPGAGRRSSTSLAPPTVRRPR